MGLTVNGSIRLHHSDNEGGNLYHLNARRVFGTIVLEKGMDEYESVHMAWHISLIPNFINGEPYTHMSGTAVITALALNI